jgi:hypothetical protein
MTEPLTQSLVGAATVPATLAEDGGEPKLFLIQARRAANQQSLKSPL